MALDAWARRSLAVALGPICAMGAESSGFCAGAKIDALVNPAALTFRLQRTLGYIADAGAPLTNF